MQESRGIWGANRSQKPKAHAWVEHWAAREARLVSDDAWVAGAIKQQSLHAGRECWDDGRDLSMLGPTPKPKPAPVLLSGRAGGRAARLHSGRPSSAEVGGKGVSDVEDLVPLQVGQPEARLLKRSPEDGGIRLLDTHILQVPGRRESCPIHVGRRGVLEIEIVEGR